MGAYRAPAVVLLLLLNALPVLSRQRADFELSRGKSGNLRIGMTVDEVYRQLGADNNVRLVDLQNEGFFTPALEIDLPGSGLKPSLVAEVSCRNGSPPHDAAPEGQSPFVVSQLVVYDPGFGTSDGLGVDSNFGDLRRLYPEAKPVA